MKLPNIFLLSAALLLCINNVIAQSQKIEVENALLIAAQNKNHLVDCSQLLVVFNENPKSFTAVFVALEKKENHWLVKQEPIEAGIGKSGFALPNKKIEGDGKSPSGIFKLGKLFSYEKQTKTLLENQQTTKDDKWIDDVNSPDYNKHVNGATDAKSYENLLLNTDVYKYCTVIEYNRNPVVKGKGSAIFFHLALNPNFFTLGCVAIKEEYMKLMISWLDPNLNPKIIMGNLDVLKAGL